MRPSDERSERGRDHDGHGSETLAKASPRDGRRQLFVAGEQVGSVRKHRGSSPNHRDHTTTTTKVVCPDPDGQRLGSSEGRGRTE